MQFVFSLLLTLAVFNGFFVRTETAAAQEAAGWQLPETLDDSNTKVTFDVDTTWHVVHGVLSGITGSVAQSDPKNPSSISGELHFPIKRIDTGWGMRNDSLYEHFETDSFAEAAVSIVKTSGTCPPATVAAGSCAISLEAMITIHGTSKPMTLPATIEKAGNGYVVSGTVTFDWASFGIKDPSMAVAKVKPNVKVDYAVTLRPAAAPAAQ